MLFTCKQHIYLKIKASEHDHWQHRGQWEPKGLAYDAESTKQQWQEYKLKEMSVFPWLDIKQITIIFSHTVSVWAACSSSVTPLKSRNQQPEKWNWKTGTISLLQKDVHSSILPLSWPHTLSLETNHKHKKRPKKVRITHHKHVHVCTAARLCVHESVLIDVCSYTPVWSRE